MAPVDVAAGAGPANNQDPEADGGLNDGLAPTDPVAPPMSVGRRQPNEPTEAERLAHNRTHIPFADWCESCVRGRGRDDPHRARQDHVEGNPIPVVQCDYFFFKAEKEDILCKAISAIDSVYNRTMALECEFKGLSDQAVPKHLPTVAWLVRSEKINKHLSRGRWPEITLVSSSPFLRQFSGENQDLMCSSSRRSGVSASGQDATTWPICTSFLTRQGALTARSIRRLAPSEAADQQRTSREVEGDDR